MWILVQDEDCLSYQVVIPDEIVKPEIESDKAIERKDEEIYEGFLKDYFQWDVPLTDLYEKWSLVDPNFRKVAKNYKGVRMLRQDPVENVFAFICSSNNNIQRFLAFYKRILSQQFTSLKHFQDQWNGGEVMPTFWEFAFDI